MRIVALLAMLLGMVGLFANTGRLTYIWLRMIVKGINPLSYGIVFGLAVLVILAVFIISRIPDNAIARSVFLIGHHALGFLIYLVIIANIVSLLPLIGKLIRLIPAPMPSGVRLIEGAVVLALTVGLTVYGSKHSANFQTNRYTVQVKQRQSELETLRIALISDTHLGYVNAENHLKKIIEAVNSMNPDLICISGDIFDGDVTALENPEKLQSMLREMDAKYGVYACLGNHDAGVNYEGMLDFISAAEIQVLMDETMVIDGRFVLAGRRDSSPIGAQGTAREELRGLPETKGLPVIIMDHQPSNIGEYGGEADLILCGHTHGGQMFPFNLVTNAIYDVDYGYYRASDTSPQVIVTSGAGTWGPPYRVATDNEVVEINVEFIR